MSLLYPGADDAVAAYPRAGASSKEHPIADQHNGDQIRHVEPSVLQNLEEQLRSREITSRFAGDYARLWAQRQRRLEGALESRDREAALDAVLSLKVSSAMIGAVRLAELAEKLELVIRAKDNLQGAGPLLVLMAEQGSATVKELQANYLRKDDIGVPG